MAHIGGGPPFFEAQDWNGIEEEMTKTFDASEDLLKLSKETFANLKDELGQNDQECQDFFPLWPSFSLLCSSFFS